MSDQNEPLTAISVSFIANEADARLRSLRDCLDGMGGFESESAAIGRVIGTLYRLREKLRKPPEAKTEAEPAKKK